LWWVKDRDRVDDLTWKIDESVPMLLQIQLPKHFRHAGELSARFDKFDPRKQDYPITELEIDLRDCEFIRPAAVLWCAVYIALASKRGARCRLLVPENLGVCVFLKSVGLFRILIELGVEADDRGIFERTDLKTILPITRFSSTNEASAVTNRAFEGLQASGVGAANLTSVVTELFGELTMNAAQHSESEFGAFGCVQVYEFGGGSRFSCTVADGGVGVRETLCRNPAHRNRVSYDWDALEFAVRERVSGTGDPHRGIGLYGVSEDLRKPNCSLLLHSGIGSLEVTEKLESRARRTRLFPGTLAFLSIPA